MLSSLNGATWNKGCKNITITFLDCIRHVNDLHWHDEINTIIQIGSDVIKAVGAQREYVFNDLHWCSVS